MPGGRGAAMLAAGGAATGAGLVVVWSVAETGGGLVGVCATSTPVNTDGCRGACLPVLETIGLPGPAAGAGARTGVGLATSTGTWGAPAGGGAATTGTYTGPAGAAGAGTGVAA